MLSQIAPCSWISCPASAFFRPPPWIQCNLQICLNRFDNLDNLTKQDEKKIDKKKEKGDSNRNIDTLYPIFWPDAKPPCSLFSLWSFWRECQQVERTAAVHRRLLLPLYARHKTRHRQERNTEKQHRKETEGNCCLCTQGNLRKEALNCNERAIGGEEEGKRYLTLGCFVEDVLLSFCVDQDGPRVGLACLDQCKTGGNNREDEVEK